jgi:hypothetical protein
VLCLNCRVRLDVVNIRFAGVFLQFSYFLRIYRSYIYLTSLLNIDFFEVGFPNMKIKIVASTYLRAKSLFELKI